MTIITFYITVLFFVVVRFIFSKTFVLRHDRMLSKIIFFELAYSMSCIMASNVTGPLL